MKAKVLVLALTLSVSFAVAQSQDAYEKNSTDSSTNKGLFDRSRLTISNSMSFGMMSNSGSSPVQSSSFYSTSLQYRFVAPVTINLNFAMPIHSTFSKYQNFSSDNMQSLEYFKNVPFDMSVSWQPSKSTLFVLSIVKTGANGYDDSFLNSPGFSPLRYRW